MRTALVALGANLPFGNRSPRETLSAAWKLLAGAGFLLLHRSDIYRTPAYPAGAGPDFVNGAILVKTPHDAAGTLAALMEAEAALGRTRARRWEARVCDLDLLAMEETVLPDAATVRAWIEAGPEAARAGAPEDLILPHPRLQERAFVLVPMAEIAPDWRHPILGRTTVELRDALPPEDLASIVPAG